MHSAFPAKKREKNTFLNFLFIVPSIAEVNTAEGSIFDDFIKGLDSVFNYATTIKEKTEGLHFFRSVIR